MTEAQAKISPILMQMDPRDIRPLDDYVLVRHLTLQGKEGSLFIPENAQENAVRSFGKGYTFRGVVLAVGPGAKYIDKMVSDGRGGKKWQRSVRSVRGEMQTKPGDIVIFERRRESEIDYQGETFSLLHEEQSILGVETQ